MSYKIKILIADDVEETRELVKTLFTFEPRFEVIGEAADGKEAVELALKLKPDIVLMDINMPKVNGLKATEEISMKDPDIIVIIMSVQKEREYLKKAMLCGAKEYIIKPFDLDTAINTIIGAYDKERERRDYINRTSLLDDNKKEPKVITVFSTKGGVGKTTIAVNTAISIAKETGDKVAIIDLDLQFGDIAVMLDIAPTKTIVDLIEDISNINSDILKEYTTQYLQGIDILPAPIKPEYAEYVNSSHIEKIIGIMKKEYQYIVIDTPTSFDDVTLSALDISDKILFVSNMDLVSIKNVRLGLDVMDSLNYSDQKVKLVINKGNQRYGIKFKDLQEAFKKEINAVIPEDNKTIITSINKGYPFMRHRKNGKIYKSIKGLASKIING